MPIVYDDIAIFFSNYIGQIITIIGSFYIGLQWLERRQNKKIKEQVEARMNLVAQQLKGEIQKIKDSVEKQKNAQIMTAKLTEKSLEYIEKSLNRIEGIEDNHSKSPI